MNQSKFGEFLDTTGIAMAKQRWTGNRKDFFIHQLRGRQALPTTRSASNAKIGLAALDVAQAVRDIKPYIDIRMGCCKEVQAWQQPAGYNRLRSRYRHQSAAATLSQLPQADIEPVQAFSEFRYGRARVICQ